MMKLVKSEVEFNREAHTYMLHGKELSGVTGMIHKRFFPDEFDNIPCEILDSAAERGKYIHSICELIDTLGVKSEVTEGCSYKTITEDWGLLHEESEYLVSDNEHFASCIDKVYRESDNEFTLADIKTTSKLNEEYVRWQLSIYAYLFELQNQGCKAVRLLGIWLRGDAYRVVELERIPNDEIVRLLACEVAGEPFTTSVTVAGCETLPDRYLKMENAIREIEENKRYWDKKHKELTEGVKKEMVGAGVYKWEGDTITFTRSKDSVRGKFDEASFKADYPDLYRQYVVDCTTSSRLTLKIKPKGGKQ